MARETSQTFDRGLRLLELLADADGAPTVTELAEALGVARPVVYRLLATLEDHGLAAADDAGRYRIGLGLVHLGGRVLPVVRAAAEPHLRLLAEEVRATAHLTVAEGDEGVAVPVVEPSSTAFHVAYRTGTRHRSTVVPLGRPSSGAATARPRRWYVTIGELQEGARGWPRRSGRRHRGQRRRRGDGRVRAAGRAGGGQAAAAIRAELPGRRWRRSYEASATDGRPRHSVGSSVGNAVPTMPPGVFDE